MAEIAEGEGIPEDDSSARFEDLTVDDDLPIIERVVRYVKSSIALQRLVHVKMLAETSALAGQIATQKVIVPCISTLLQDPESVIRQHIAAQLLPVSVTCMLDLQGKPVKYYIENPTASNKIYNEGGYRIVLDVVTDCLMQLLSDSEIEVRRAAADAICGLSLMIKETDVAKHLIRVPLKLAGEKPKNTTSKKRSEEEQRQEELRITAANVLAEIGGSASEHGRKNLEFVRTKILPCILDLSGDPSFRLRRAAAQALPRLLGACELSDATDHILPAFCRLSQDDIHRVRKSTGECLVDMSRAIVIMADAKPDIREELYEQRRTVLLPIAERLIQDSHKMVRQGMMQFLGPFMASFYPFQYTKLHDLLPAVSEADGSNHMGIVAQFFPHATSMVSRLNSSQNATQSAPTPVHSSLAELNPKVPIKLLPQFIIAARNSHLSLAAVTQHRKQNPPDAKDIRAIVDTVLDYFVALAAVQTGDDNTDAEMRVYCAYSFPAVVLLLGGDHWEGAVRTCFHTLLNPMYPEEPSGNDEDDEDDCEPPLPVKRCLASSLHTVAHILGKDIDDIVGIVQSSFLNDADDSVRLSTLRNFPSLLRLLQPKQRRAPFTKWAEMVNSEDVMPKKRSATNPVVLNWRQRDYLARSLPELILLVDPVLIHKHVWPILKTLLTDPINVVREDALWTIPILLQVYCVDTLSKWPHIAEHAKKFSAEACTEITTWIKNTILRNKSKKEANFTDRQLYCRICTAFGLALRFGEGDTTAQADPDSVIKFRSFVTTPDQGPYQLLTKHERNHLKRILTEDLLPVALEFKQDRISNVRITLMKGLQVLPVDIREMPSVKTVLKELEDESETWTSFGEEDIPLVDQQQRMMQGQQQQQQQQQRSATGPVDVDRLSSDDGGQQESDGSSNQSDAEETPAPQQQQQQASPLDQLGLKTVIFEDGSIGMQLEPTSDDTGCRVVGFIENGDQPSPAKASGKIQIGDVAIRINGNRVTSYDSAIQTLKAGGRRKITFRPGRPEDTADDAQSVESEDSDIKKTKTRKGVKKDKTKKEKKEKKPKKEKKEKKAKK